MSLNRLLISLRTWALATNAQSIALGRRSNSFPRVPAPRPGTLEQNHLFAAGPLHRQPPHYLLHTIFKGSGQLWCRQNRLQLELGREPDRAGHFGSAPALAASPVFSQKAKSLPEINSRIQEIFLTRCSCVCCCLDIAGRAFRAREEPTFKCDIQPLLSGASTLSDYRRGLRRSTPFCWIVATMPTIHWSASCWCRHTLPSE